MWRAIVEVTKLLALAHAGLCVCSPRLRSCGKLCYHIMMDVKLWLPYWCSVLCSLSQAAQQCAACVQICSYCSLVNCRFDYFNAQRS